MSFALLRSQTLKPRTLPQIYSLSRACYHPPQSQPTKDQEQFFMPPDYPEEPPNFVMDQKKRVMKWDEADATLSEASVKADRGLAGNKDEPVKKWKTWEFEKNKNKEPELDEL